ncbi:MAG: PP2C family protein-serine/threonine phosphatase [bacterium]
MAKSTKVQIRTAVATDVGNLRKVNEDSHFVAQDGNLVIVCDGMGGHVAGGFSSKLAIETMKDVFQNLEQEHVDRVTADMDESFGPTIRRLVAAVRIANRRIFKIAIRIPTLRGMGTTMVALSFDKNFAHMVHVGDSRIFRARKGKLDQLTEDHSLLNELIQDKELKPEEITVFMHKNIITRALGTSLNVKIDLCSEKYKKDDLYILSTDGLHNALATGELQAISEDDAVTLEEKAEALIEVAKKRDGSDNMTIALAHVLQNSKRTQAKSVAATIPEEKSNVSAKEDKLIHKRYNDAHLTLSKRNHTNKRFFVVAGFVLLAAIFGYGFGHYSQQEKTNYVSDSLPYISVKRNAELKGNRAFGDAWGTKTERPSRANVQKDAVMAILLFNSLEDFEQAVVNSHEIVYDWWYPYLYQRGDSQVKKFSFTLLDSSNKELRRTEQILLPPLLTE